MVVTIGLSILFLFDFMTEIFDVSFSHVDTLLIGGRRYRFDSVKVAGKSIVILECEDFTRCIRILVYKLRMCE